MCGVCGRIWMEEKAGPPSAERIEGFVVSTITGEKTLFSGLSNVHCLLIFTTDRLVVQKGSSQMRQNIPNYRRIEPHLARLLEENGIEGLLADSSENFFIRYSDILRVELGRRWLNPRMNVMTNYGLYRFTWFWPWATSGRVERVLRSRFPLGVPVQRVKGN